jgi:hypothetical protein
MIAIIGASLLLCACQEEHMNTGGIDWGKNPLNFDNNVDFFMILRQN